jgi:molybdopterin-guanine dinucleotide biosynthesis protein A
MGRNKALVKVGGRPVIERIVARVRPLGDELILITNTPELYEHLRLPMFPDILPGRGPLGGLYTALTYARHDYALVVSCDQPFLNVDLLRYLIGRRESCDVVVPLARDNYPQSMHAVYSKLCLAPIRQRLDADRLKVIGFFQDVHVCEVAGQEIDQFDPDRISFINVNTPEDLAVAQRLAERLG